MSSPNNQPPAEDRIFTSEGFAAELFWEKNRQTILIVAGVVVVAAIGTVFWLISSHNSRLASEAAFATADKQDAWREVISKYPGSPAAGDASFLLAKSLRDEGKFEESTAIYKKLISDYSEYPLSSGARLGIAENYAAEGKSAEALTALSDVQAAAGYAAPYAAFMEGRALLREGKLAEAKEVFSKIATTYQNTPLARVAVGSVNEIDSVLPPQGAK